MNKLIGRLTHFLPRWINKRLQRRGERRRSAIAALEPESNLPFPYNDAFFLEAHELNKKFTEQPAEDHWLRVQAIMNNEQQAKWAAGPRSAS